MSTIQCFWLEPTTQERYGLRRFTWIKDVKLCPSVYVYHNALVLLGKREHSDASVTSTLPDAWPHDDSRWPRQCEHCDYVFTDDDAWQLWCEHLYLRTDSGEITTLRDAPPGAMWDATWYAPARERPDGVHLLVKTPGGEWDVDSVASNGPGWERSGAVPQITATPSIMAGSYHGWLKNGQLVD